MKTPRLVAALLATAAPALAALNSGIIVLPLTTTRTAPAVTLVLPADYLCATVTLRTTTKDIDRQSSAMRSAVRLVTETIEKAPRFQLHQGAARFAGPPGPLYSPQKGSDPAVLQTDLRILAPLQGTDDIFESLRQLRRFIGGISPGENVELVIVSVSVAVNDPEQYRSRLLGLMAEQTRSVQQTFATRTTIIDGLQNPVIVRQVDDSHVELSIDYQISATIETR